MMAISVTENNISQIQYSENNTKEQQFAIVLPEVKGGNVNVAWFHVLATDEYMHINIHTNDVRLIKL